MISNTDISMQEPQAGALDLEAEAALQRPPGKHQASTGSNIARAALVLMAGTILSRVLGVGRESSIAFLFGAGPDVDAFTIANNVATIVYDLLISGTVSAALVPVFSEYTSDVEHRPEFGRVVSTVLTVAALFLVAAVTLLEIFAEPLVGFMSAGFSKPGTRELALVMTQWVLPGVLFMGLSGVVMAANYSLKRFVYPAFTSALFNASIIFCGFTLAGILGVKSLALGLVVGAFAMLAMQAPGLRDIRLRPVLDIHHPAVRKIVRLYAPVGLSVLVAAVALVIDRNLASQTGEGSISAMRFATTLVQFALGMVSAAISIAALPTLSQHFSNGDIDAYKRTLATGLRLVTVLVLPAAAGLLALAGPLVALLFGHGATTPDDQARIVLALLFYVPGLPFSAIDQVLIFAFYARKNTITPALIGIAQFGVYLVIALSTYGTLKMPGLVLANSVQLIFHATVTGFFLWRVLRAEGGMRGYGIGQTTLKSGVASIAIAVVSYGMWLTLHRLAPSASLFSQALGLAAAAAVGASLYMALLWFLRVPELQLISDKVRSRIKR
ncbi:MAG: murein biosynthesis integral membrane protein MurJ [Chloroflexi bacterium]|nr:murein biosynthesis integral membrane protein MurJ [Chloroflexota bacterium]